MLNYTMEMQTASLDWGKSAGKWPDLQDKLISTGKPG